jgi:hypothetical protein
MHTSQATNDALTLNRSTPSIAMVRYSLLFVVAALMLGCGSSGSSTKTTPLEENRPLLECDGGRYDQYMTVTATARSLQLSLVRRKVFARGQAKLAVRVRSSLQDYFSERRPETLQDRFSSGLQAQVIDSLESSITRAAGEVVAGAEMIQCDTFVKERGEARLYEMDADVGIPIGESASAFAARVSQNPTLKEAFEDPSAIREVIRQWLRWSLTRGVAGGGQGQGASGGTNRN